MVPVKEMVKKYFFLSKSALEDGENNSLLDNLTKILKKYNDVYVKEKQLTVWAAFHPVATKLRQTRVKDPIG